MSTSRKLALPLLATIITLGLNSFVQAQPQQDRDILSLSAQAQTNVAQDTVTITLFDEQQNSSAAVLTKALNEKTAHVLAQAKQYPQVKVFSGQFSIYPMNNKDNQIDGWRGRSEVILESHDFAAASKLAGNLSNSMQISNISFSLSEKQQQIVQQKLIKQAVENFQNKALSTVRALGYKSYRIRDINLGQNYAAPRAPMMLAAAYNGASQSNQPISMQAGETLVSIHLQGSVQMLK